MIELDERPDAAVAACSVCGGRTFVPGPNGRYSTFGRSPRCAGCGSLERHRALRRLYDVLPDRFLQDARAIQFADDPAAPRARFGSFELSTFGGKNSLDLMGIDRADASYDWVIANHVLEHVPNDFLGLAELLRIAGRRGIVQIAVPMPKVRFETFDLARASARAHGHYRGYGSDFPLRVRRVLKGVAGLSVILTDPSTETWDVAYLFSADAPHLFEIGHALLAAHLPVLRCA